MFARIGLAIILSLLAFVIFIVGVAIIPTTRDSATFSDVAAAAPLGDLSTTGLRRAPAPASSQPRGATMQGMAIILATTAVRIGPGEEYDLIGRLGEGDAVKVAACTPGCTWYRTEAGGWIPAAMQIGAPTDLPIIADVAAVVPTATPTPEPPALILPTVTPTMVPPTPFAWPGAYAIDVAILRRGPGTVYDQALVALANEPLVIVAQNQAGDWYQLDNGLWIAVFLVGNRPEIAPPIAANIPPLPAGARDLDVQFSGAAYQCVQSSMSFDTVDGMADKPWVYRSFQVEMQIQNLNTQPILPGYAPTRWIITDGTTDSVMTTSWQRTGRGPATNHQIILYYEDMHSDTWYTVALARDQWVKAVEFDWNGQVYHTDFDLGPAGNGYNYKDCGEDRSQSS
ncbi:MAG: hypothetical protein KDE24_03505 [Caldilinea sp.]|nr:hypothetical protein [Caldilinea sp.]MCB0048597.1 hypothetical protein [Caldilinea sp.]